ncbi:MAG: flagellar biosynthetic protein FliR [Planctomycetes bacterium]|nr:flagellar biosynthetic protein FliR [Planctomycetota bacterium]
MNDLFLKLLPVRIEYAILFLTRILALISTAPIFGTMSPWSSYKIMLGVTITAVLLPAIGEPEWKGPDFGFALVPLIIMELLVGALMGWILTAAFSSVRLAGELVTSEMGLNLSSLLDPVTGTSSPVVTSFYQTLAGLIFVIVGAHRWTIVALARSFETIPVGTFHVSANSVDGMLMIMARFLEAGIVLAAPVMVAMFVITVLLGVISRAVPQLNILETGYALRVGTALGIAAILLPAFRFGLESLFTLTQSALFEAVPAMQGK